MEDNYFTSVGVIVKRDNQVLLVRHTYGSAKGKLLNPGGYLQENEMPFDAAMREVKEETGIEIKPIGMLALRCSQKCWYMVIQADYVSGTLCADGDEIDKALFMDVNRAIEHPQVTDTAKKLIKLSQMNEPLLPIDAGKGRVLFAVR